jgi:hypothetical protein
LPDSAFQSCSAVLPTTLPLFEIHLGNELHANLQPRKQSKKVKTTQLGFLWDHMFHPAA